MNPIYFCLKICTTLSLVNGHASHFDFEKGPPSPECGNFVPKFETAEEYSQPNLALNVIAPASSHHDSAENDISTAVDASTEESCTHTCRQPMSPGSKLATANAPPMDDLDPGHRDLNMVVYYIGFEVSYVGYLMWKIFGESG
ncbi:hypothetical protein GOP47_0025300 [Adiantum capillus-veneris]|uniref:Uncharacterized protein n=1 Tax=Adiantum capillus-veneris TaxID=13818 RepID=A0A9D4U2J7_ADICA|nr:hypothetical protein GOP47_0025300 [Adiantum capillus-veneris]